MVVIYQSEVAHSIVAFALQFYCIALHWLEVILGTGRRILDRQVTHWSDNCWVKLLLIHFICVAFYSFLVFAEARKVFVLDYFLLEAWSLP